MLPRRTLLKAALAAALPANAAQAPSRVLPTAGLAAIELPGIITLNAKPATLVPVEIGIVNGFRFVTSALLPDSTAFPISEKAQEEYDKDWAVLFSSEDYTFNALLADNEKGTP